MPSVSLSAGGGFQHGWLKVATPVMHTEMFLRTELGVSVLAKNGPRAWVLEKMPILGGNGNSKDFFCSFSPRKLGKFSSRFDEAYFSDGLVQPPTIASVVRIDINCRVGFFSLLP